MGFFTGLHPVCLMFVSFEEEGREEESILSIPDDSARSKFLWNISSLVGSRICFFFKEEDKDTSFGFSFDRKSKNDQ